MTISSKDYDKKYFEIRKAYSDRNTQWKRTYASIKTDNPKTVLDVGCGTGQCVAFLRERGLDAWGTDFSEDAFNNSIVQDFQIIAPANELPFADKSFDVVVSSDFFEHIKEEEIDAVYREMLRVGKKVYARICFKEEPPYHLTVKPKEWWSERLKDITIIT